MEFPRFSYADPKAYSFAFNTPQFSAPMSASKPSNPFDINAFMSGKDFNLDKAAAYALMQSLDPAAKAQMRKQELADALEFQRTQMREALPYKLLLDLPDKITAAFTVPGAIRLAGAQSAANTMVEGVRAAAASQTPFAYQRPNVQYFR